MNAPDSEHGLDRWARMAAALLVFGGLLFAMATTAPSPAGAQALVPLEHVREVAEQVRGSARCGECHENAYAVWKQTAHAEGFEKLHKKKRAAQITKKLGLRLVKRNSPCLACHFTPKIRGDNVSAASGTSCESCHGAGVPWVDLHNDYGDASWDTESAEHRQARIAQARQLGMRRPSDLYPVVANCYQCHLVPNQELVEKGGHTTGTAGFEFVEYSQDKGIRHNFLAAELRGQGVRNAKRPPETRRLMYVVGQAVGLEYSLRGAAVATSSGDYLESMAERIDEFRANLEEIQAAVPLPEVAAILSATSGVEASAGGDAALTKAADAVRVQAQALVTNQKGADLAALDDLTGGEDEELVADPASPGATVDASLAGAASSPAAPAPGAAAAGGVPATGKFKQRIRPQPSRKTVKANSCTKSCHEDAVSWMKKHPHGKSHKPFVKGRGNNVNIATLYGIRPGDLAKGTSVCADCHATVQTGKARSAVRHGVTCQGCHGAAGDYLKKHRDGGLAVAASLGMRDLSKPDVLAKTCTGCHYITDERLLSAGHTSGEGFDYAGNLADIQHWDGGLPPSSGFAAELSRRGPVPEVKKGKLPDGVAVAAGPARSAGASSASGGGAASAADAGAGDADVADEADEEEELEEEWESELGLPRRPDVGPESPAEDSLQAVMDRIEEIHRRLPQ